jgi:dihydroorotate dehydrogenase electron transfer subunit
MDVVSSQVLFNRPETRSVYRLGFRYDAFLRGPRAARFVMLSLHGPQVQVLPRPFSLSDAYRDEQGLPVAEVLYKPIGRVTSRMALLREGDEISVGGLCGNGFPDPSPKRRPVLLAGGIGNAPFALQIRELISGPFAGREAEILVFLAGRSSEDIYLQQDARAAGVTVVEVTEDGSRGERGRITDALVRRLGTLGPIEGFACGPEPMLHALKQLAKEHEFPCHLAVEERMACGYGVCNACVILSEREGVDAADAPYLRACIDGPVFESREICL